MSAIEILSVHLRVEENSMAGEARRLATSMAADLGFSQTDGGRVAIIAAELSKNILAHAVRGELIIQPTVPSAGLEILALDKGPGMVNPTRCLEDGFSTAGTSGTGLGAIARQSDVFDLFTRPGKGTVVLSRIYPSARPPAQVPIMVGGVVVPICGERVCGDAWTVLIGGTKIWLLAADGSGHGDLAAEAAREAVRVLQSCAVQNPAEAVAVIHAALVKTRGAAIAVAELNLNEGLVEFAGIGNIAGVVAGNSSVRSMVSHNGTAGHSVRKIQQFQYPWSAEALIILCSDGISTQWDLKPYPGLMMKHPSVVAAVIYRDFARGRDDASVVVARRADLVAV